MSRPKVLATICARGGSKGVKNKNIRVLDGEPLLIRALRIASECPGIDKIIISTDSPEIADVASAAGYSVPFMRPKEFAGDNAAKIHAIRHATEFVEAEGFHPDIIVDLDVCVPFRTSEDIMACIDLFSSGQEIDAAVTIYEAERNPYFNMVEYNEEHYLKLVKPTPEPIVARQQAPEVFSISPSVFAFRREKLYEIVHLYSGKWAGHIVSKEKGLDIDTEFEFLIAEMLVQRH